ncbi:MAG TPA: hypothetical protein VI977_00575 [archaeon]|nr:hypothetical protein [archaeon]
MKTRKTKRTAKTVRTRAKKAVFYKAPMKFVSNGFNSFANLFK